MSDGIHLTLPDGSVRTVDRGTTPLEVARGIGARLARAAVVARVDGALWDLDRPLTHDASIAILTDSDPQALEVLRHSAAHIMATAVRELFPGAGIGFGPPIEDGFYYDFEVPQPFTPADLERIESRMAEVARRDDAFIREVVTGAEAQSRFRDDRLKLERIGEFADGETITVYQNGPFVDLCRGPHIPSTGRLKHFKLLSTAGAYWRGDERRQMLQRIYGTAWFKKDDLEAYLHRMEEAKKRDHRVLGRQLDLYSIQEEIGPGLVLWHPKGAMVKLLLSRAVEDDNLASGYQMVSTPNITREELFKISGHLPLYADNQYPAMGAAAGESDEVRYRVKPMNCPMHAMIYRAQQRSYRDLPLRLSEIANVYRNERSGVLHGLLRVRGLAMDDGHIFCTMDQIEDEIFLCLGQVERLVGKAFGFPLAFEISTRPEEKLGDDAIWDRAEAILRGAMDRAGIPYDIDAGGGAFYGPKIDVKFEDAIGRVWQGPTIQLDFNLPERFELEYTGPDNQPHRPAMIHRAIYGSLERFIGTLIEHFAGAFPLWLAPEQVRVLPISDGQADTADRVGRQLEAVGIRVHVDARPETLNYRIREGEMLKIPYMAVVGQREADAGTVAVRMRGAGKKQEIMPVEAFAARLLDQIASRAIEPYGVAVEPAPAAV